MKVFVAGASGALGRRMIPQLLAAGHSGVAVTRDPARAEPLRLTGAEAVVCDVSDAAAAVRAAVSTASPDAIINQLTDRPATMNPRRLKAIYAGNNRVRRDGTANLIAAGRAAGVSRIVVQSMGTWYPPDDPGVERGPAVEADAPWTDAPEPISAAVRTVAEMEAAVLRDVPIAAILRYGAAVERMPVYARALGAPLPRRVPMFLARLAIGTPLTQWVTTMRGASNRAAVAGLGWRPRFPSWRDAFAASLNARR